MPVPPAYFPPALLRCIYLDFPAKELPRGQFAVQRRHSEPLCRRFRPGNNELGGDLRRHDGRTVESPRVCRSAIGCRRTSRGPRNAPFLPLPARAGRTAAGRAAFALDSGRGTQPGRGEPPHIVGFFARDQGAAVPGRLISSAKSWLCHSGVDRTAELLPWHGAADVHAPVAG